MHPSTFEYRKPSDAQIEKMQIMRDAAKDYAMIIEEHVPDGPDKTYILRQLRTVAMWVNVAIDRLPDGTPREGQS